MLELSKEEAMFMFGALENSQIKGSMAPKIVTIFEKLNKYIIEMQQEEDKAKIAETTGVDPSTLIQE